MADASGGDSLSAGTFSCSKLAQELRSAITIPERARYSAPAALWENLVRANAGTPCPKRGTQSKVLSSHLQVVPSRFLLRHGGTTHAKEALAANPKATAS